MNLESTRTSVTRARSLAVAVVAAGLVLGGCANEPAIAPEPPPATAPSPGTDPGDGASVDPAALEYTSSVCTALVPLVERVQAPPAPDVTDPAATQQALLTYASEAQADVEAAAEEVAAAGAPPVEGGEQLAQDVSAQLDELRTVLADATAQIDQVDPNNPVAVGQAALAVATEVGAALGSVAGAVSTIARDAELGPAFEQAPACDPLREIVAPTPS